MSRFRIEDLSKSALKFIAHSFLPNSSKFNELTKSTTYDLYGRPITTTIIQTSSREGELQAGLMITDELGIIVIGSSDIESIDFEQANNASNILKAVYDNKPSITPGLDWDNEFTV